MHAMVRTTILIVVGQLRSDQWDVMNLDGRIMSQQTSGGVCMAAKFGRAKFHEFRCQVISRRLHFNLLDGLRRIVELLNSFTSAEKVIRRGEE